MKSGELRTAQWCDDYRRYWHRSKPSAIGQLLQVRDIDRPYQVGWFVFCKQLDQGWLIELPLTPGQVAEQKDRGSLITTTRSIMGWPQDWLRVVDP